MLRAIPISCKGMLERGFTTVRDVGGAPIPSGRGSRKGMYRPAPLRLRQGAAKTGGHTRHPPRYDTGDPTRSGMHLGALGRLCDGSATKYAAPAARNCGQELRFIKIMANGGVATPTDPMLVGYSRREEFAPRWRKRANARTYVAAHLYTRSASARRRVRRAFAGTLQQLIDASTARLAAGRGAVAVPTLVTYEAFAQNGPS